LRNNVRGGIEAWLAGSAAFRTTVGCRHRRDLSITGLAMAEAQAKLEDGRPLDEALVRHLIGEGMAKLKQVIGSDRHSDDYFAKTVDLFLKVAISPQLIDFLTHQEVTTVQRKDDQRTIP
jgi:hypothetical protein